MNLEQVKAAIERNKKPLAIAGAAAVAGLGVMKARSGGTASTPAARTAAKPSGVAVGGFAPSTADTSTTDAFSSITSSLSSLHDKLTPPIPVPAPPRPIASTLFAPTGSGVYLRQGKRDDGKAVGVFEVQTDGSLYHLSGSEWQQLIKDNRGKIPAVNQLDNDDVGGVFFRARDNIAARTKGATPQGFTTNARGSVVGYKKS